MLAVVIFSISLFLLFPSDLLETMIEGRFQEKADLSLSIDTLQKSLPFGFKAKRVGLSEKGETKEVFYLEDARVKLYIPSLLIGRVRIFLDGAMGGGDVHGEVLAVRSETWLDVEAVEVGLDAIPYLAPIGLKGGSINARSRISLKQKSCPSGFLEIDGRDIDLKQVRFMGMALPIGTIKKAGGELDFIDSKGCKVIIKGLWTDGDTLSTRIEGEVSIGNPIGKSRLNLTVEITLRGELKENATFQALLRPYRRSANFYSMPIKGSIRRPILGG